MSLFVFILAWCLMDAMMVMRRLTCRSILDVDVSLDEEARLAG